MENFLGVRLTPLFYSEISSTYMIFEIFRNHDKVGREFMRRFLGLEAGTDVYISRERNYKNKGSVDLFLSFESQGLKKIVLMEVKVHDYSSATPGQIRTYYDAAIEETNKGEVYFIYLTQFNRNNFSSQYHSLEPPTIREFEISRNELKEYKDRLKHITWEEFHHFMDDFKEGIYPEEKCILGLQKKWITEKSAKDLKDNIVDVGERNLMEYFDDLEIDLPKEIPSGKTKNKNKRLIFGVDLSECKSEELDNILKIIKKFANSSRIDKNVANKTEEYTLAGAKEFLSGLAQEEVGWKLLSFYSALFHFANNTGYLLFNGTGSRGFSIKVNVIGKGMISLCTLWGNKTLEFSLKR